MSIRCSATHWKPPQQVLELQIRRLPPTQNHLDDVGRQQGQPQNDLGANVEPGEQLH